MLMWPVFIVQFKSEVLINNAGGEVQLITSYLHIFWVILNVLCCVVKLYIRALRGNLPRVNVASIRRAIQFRVFDQ